MSWIKDFKRDFRSTLYTKIFLFIGLASMIFFPGIVYWNYHSDIDDIDKFEAAGFKGETITDIFDRPSRVGRGQRKTFTVSGHDYNSFPVYLESSENMNQITVGAKIQRRRIQGNFLF